jgi:hypothetical protein
MQTVFAVWVPVGVVRGKGLEGAVSGGEQGAEIKNSSNEIRDRAISDREGKAMIEEAMKSAASGPKVSREGTELNKRVRIVIQSAKGVICGALCGLSGWRNKRLWWPEGNSSHGVGNHGTRID